MVLSYSFTYLLFSNSFLKRVFLLTKSIIESSTTSYLRFTSLKSLNSFFEDLETLVPSLELLNNRRVVFRLVYIYALLLIGFHLFKELLLLAFLTFSISSSRARRLGTWLAFREPINQATCIDSAWFYI